MSGEVDLCTAPWLAEELRRVRRSGLEIIVDLEQVEFLDCAGLRVLLSFSGSDKEGQAGFSVTPGPRQVQKLFELAGVGELLRVACPAAERRLVA